MFGRTLRNKWLMLLIIHLSMGVVAHIYGHIEGSSYNMGEVYVILAPIIGLMSFVSLGSDLIGRSSISTILLAGIYISSNLYFIYLFHLDKRRLWIPIILGISATSLIRMPFMLDVMMSA